MVSTPVLGRHLIAGLVACAPTVGATTHMLVAVGLGGEPEYEAAFAEQGSQAAARATATGAQVALLTGPAARREGIRDAVAEIMAAAEVGDAVVVHLIGHGSYDDEHYRFNVPGPDPTAAELAEWLRPSPAERLAILATSASGAAVEPLQAAGAAVVAATRDGGEKNAVVFGRFWTEALADPGADTNKDGRIAADEAFRFAARAVADYYERLGRIATEHPRLEGSATAYILAALERVDPDLPSAFAHLVAQADALSREVEALKAEKAELSEDDYFSRLQELLLRLAHVERQLSQARSAPSNTTDAKP